MHPPPNGAVIQIRKGPGVLLARVMARKGERLLSVLGDDGATYILRQDVPSGAWGLTMYRRAGAPDG